MNTENMTKLEKIIFDRYLTADYYHSTGENSTEYTLGVLSTLFNISVQSGDVSTKLITKIDTKVSELCEEARKVGVSA